MEENASLAGVPSRSTLSTCVVDVVTSTDVISVSVAGELDMADADQVGDVLINAADAGKPLVRLVLSDLRFADSSAIKAILIGARVAQDRGVRYELVNPRGLVKRLLEVTGLDSALNVVHEPQDDAA
ncbi:MAG TPA: STAS domain-containing protein [Ilumatobacteraceae bacterium]|jgi:anti-anti-sigma factor